MTDIIGKTLGARSLDRIVAKTLHRYGIGVNPRLVDSLCKIGFDLELDVPIILQSYGIDNDKLEKELIVVMDEAYE